jgi:hypothetical protein
MMLGRTAITEHFFSEESHWLDLAQRELDRTRRGYYVDATALCGLRATWSTSTFGSATCPTCRAKHEEREKRERELTR